MKTNHFLYRFNLFFVGLVCMLLEFKFFARESEV